MYKDVSIYLAGYSTQQWKKSTQYNTTVTQANMALGWSLTKCKDLPVWVYDLTFVYISAPPHIITNTAVHKEGGGGKKSGYTSDQTVLKRALFTKSWPGSAARSYSSSLKKDVVF